MDWVRTPHNNFINIRSAVSGKVVDSRGGPRVELKDAHGNTVGITSPDDLAPPAVLVGGATPAVFITDTGDVAAVPIVAWTVSRTTKQAEPVFLSPRPPGAMFLHLSGGAVL